MKCIFIILICFLGLTSTSQVQKQPRSNFPTVVDSSLAIGKNFILPVFRSFSQLATYNVLDSSGRLVFIRDSNAVFFRDNAHTWVKLAYFDAGSDAWQLTGNTISSGQFLGTINNLALALKAYNKNVASFNGNTMIVSLGDIDSLNNGTSLIINDQQGNDGLTKGRYEFNRRNFKIGQIDYIFPPAQGAPGSYLYNPGNGFLTWNIPGSSGTFPGIDSFTISPPPPSLTTSVGYWIDGAPIFYPLAGDSSKVINDTLFQYFGGDSIPYPVYGNQIFFGDTATISGDIFCSIKNGNDSCILINNNGRFVDSIGLNSDSTEYLYFNNDVQLGSFPTLQKILAPEPGQRATLRASNDSVYVGFNETGLPQSNSYLVSTGGVVLVDSTLTVTAPILWVYRGADSSELSNQVFTINTAATGDLRTDIIWIDSLGVFTKTVGTPDSVTAVAPMIDYNGIIVAYADIDGSTITVNGVSSFQGNGVVYTQGVGVNNGQAKTDSVNFNYNETTRNLTLAGTFVSNKVGGVALSIDGGSAIRADRGSRIVYIDGDTSVTMRSGGYNFKAALNGQGEFIIGSSGQVRVPSARLAVIDSTKGFLPPVMRGVRMEAISSPATGLIVYNSDSSSLCLYNGSAWVKLGSGGSGSTSTLQQAFDAAPTASPQIQVNTNTDFKINGTNSAGSFDFTLSRTADPFIQFVTTNESPFDITNSVVLGAAGIEIARNSTDGSYNSVFRFVENEAIFQNTGSNGLKYQVGINKSPDSALDVSGGVSFDLYESSDGTDSMVVKNADGGLGIRAIPGGGSTDTSGFAHKSYNLTETITGAKTFTGASTFSNTANGTANTTITGGVQGGSDNVGLLINGTFAGATNAHPFRVTPNFGFTSNGFAGAGIDVPFVTSGTANHDHVVGFQSVGTHGSSGTMTNAYGAYLGYVTNGGVTTNSYGVHIINPTGSGTITNNVGLYIANQTKGATNLGIQVAGSTAIEVGGISYLLGNAIVGHTTGVAPGADFEVRNNGAVGSRLRNNAQWVQWSLYSGSTDASFGTISGNNMKIYDGGNKTFFAPAQDSVSNSGLWVNHSLATAYLASSSSTINVSSNNFTVNADATSTNITANLPTAVGCKGRIYVVRKADASVNTVTIDGNGSETINGSTTVVLSTQYSFRMMQSDGANWMVISQL